MLNIQIIRPQKSELDAIRKHLEYTISETFKEAGVFESAYDEYVEEIEYQTEKFKIDFDTQGTEEYFLLAKSENKIIGTIGYGKPNPVIKEYFPKLDDTIGEIKAVYINPAYQNQKVGTKLFQAILAYLNSQNIEEFILDCGYKKSQPFWIKLLDEPTILLKDFYQPDSHHMIWRSEVQIL